MYELDAPLAPEVVDKYTPPALVAYIYPSVGAGPAAEGAEEVRVAVRWDSSRPRPSSMIVGNPGSRRKPAVPADLR